MSELLDIMVSFVAGLLPFLLSMLFGVYAFFIFSKMKKNTKKAHDIAVIGFPQSGKTTFITTLFHQMQYNNVFNIKIDIRGTTIDRVNEDIRKIEIGQRLGATTDQDRFAYRFDMPKSNLFKETIKVEIGDFRGENTESFYRDFGQWLHKTPFFKWVMQADAFIFVVDVANVLLDKQYKAQMITSITAAWQHITDYHIESKKRVDKNSVSIIFTKSDLLYIDKSDAEIIQTLGFKEFPEKTTISDEAKLNTKQIEDDFIELKNYFKQKKINSKFFFTSCFIYDEAEKSILGMRKIVSHILFKCL